MMKPAKVSIGLKDVRINHSRMQAAEARGKKRGTTKALAFIRRNSQWKVLKRRKSASKPGNPPSIHARGQISLKNIRFGYESVTESGVVGPIRLNHVPDSTNPGQTVPNVLEKGGTMMVDEVKVNLPDNRGSFWRRRDKRRRLDGRRQYRRRRVTIKPRPFMSVALDNEVKSGNVEGAFADVVT